MDATADAEDDGPADADGSSRGVGLADRMLAAVFAAFVGIGGYFLIILWSVLLLGSLTTIAPDATPVLEQGLGSLANGLGGVMAVLLFLYGTDRGIEFLDLERPTWRELGYAVAGIVLLLMVWLGVQWLFTTFEIDTADHSLAEIVRENPAVLAVLIPGSWLFVGPGEELLYRNAIQKSLYDSFPTWGAIVVTSGVFAVVHFPAFVGGSTAATLASLALVFFLSGVLGWLYARTGNVLVPVFVHGTFNAIQFALLHPAVGSVGPLG